MQVESPLAALPFRGKAAGNSGYLTGEAVQVGGSTGSCCMPELVLRAAGSVVA